MIAGETEAWIAHNTGDQASYDNFLFFGRKKKSKERQEKKAARKARRKSFWNNLGQSIKDSGGIAGIAGSVEELVSPTKSKEAPNEPGDFEFGLKQPDDPAGEKKAVPTSMYIVGGAVILGIGVYAFSYMKKVKHIKNSAGK